MKRQAESAERSAVRGERQALKKIGGRQILFLCLLLAACCSLACSVPKLETDECAEARIAVREFYSAHFGGDMQFTPENLKARERFLTAELIKTLPVAPSNRDPFTLTDDPPKAFRVGGCQTIEPQKRTGFEVLIFWKTDTRSEQREIRIEAVKSGDAGEKWLIDKISN